jgi:hypothetical protein
MRSTRVHKLRANVCVCVRPIDFIWRLSTLETPYALALFALQSVIFNQLQVPQDLWLETGRRSCWITFVTRDPRFILEILFTSSGSGHYRTRGARTYWATFSLYTSLPRCNILRSSLGLITTFFPGIARVSCAENANR